MRKNIFLLTIFIVVVFIYNTSFSNWYGSHSVSYSNPGWTVLTAISWWWPNNEPGVMKIEIMFDESIIFQSADFMILEQIQHQTLLLLLEIWLVSIGIMSFLLEVLAIMIDGQINL